MAQLAAIQSRSFQVCDPNCSFDSADPSARRSPDLALPTPSMQDVFFGSEPFLPRRFHGSNLDLPLLLPAQSLPPALLLDFADQYAGRAVPELPIDRVFDPDVSSELRPRLCSRPSGFVSNLFVCVGHLYD